MSTETPVATEHQTLDGRRTMEVRRLGVISYGDALELQAELVKQRRAGEIPTRCC